MELLQHDIEKFVRNVVKSRLHGNTWNQACRKVLGQNYTNELKDRVYRVASKRIRNILSEKPHDLKMIHIERYELLFNRLYDLGYDREAMRALSYIQKLGGVHSYTEENFTQLFSTNNTNQELLPEYNLDRLSEVQQKRLKHLLIKIKK